MTIHKTITIKVAYDATHDIPTDEFLREGVFFAVEDGLLSHYEEDTVVETWDVEIT